MDLIDREKLLEILSEQAPSCREPQVQFTTKGCNCWSGINQAIRVIEQFERAAT